MEGTTVSSKYQIVIPKKIREQFDIRPGQKLIFIPYKQSLRLIIVPPIEKAFGFVEGIDTKIDRETEERV